MVIFVLGYIVVICPQNIQPLPRPSLVKYLELRLQCAAWIRIERSFIREEGRIQFAKVGQAAVTEARARFLMWPAWVSRDRAINLKTASIVSTDHDGSTLLLTWPYGIPLKKVCRQNKYSAAVTALSRRNKVEAAS